MDITSSVAKGCFVFKPKSVGSGKKGHREKQPDPLDDFSDKPWYKAYCEAWQYVEDKTECLQEGISEVLLQDLINFISKSDSTNNILPAATLLTGVNLPDHASLFGTLTSRLHAQLTPHIAMLTSDQCPTLKHTIEQMTAHFINAATKPLDQTTEFSDSNDEMFDEAKRSECTLATLSHWYAEQNTKPSTSRSAQSPAKRRRKQPAAEDSLTHKLVVILPDFEGFATHILHDFLLILSEYASSLPFVLVLGVATTVSAIHNALPHSVIARLSLRLFQSQPSIHFLNNTLNQIFLMPDCPFQLGGKVINFLTDVFLYFDFSVNGFIRGIKYSLMEHMFGSGMSTLCCEASKLKKGVRHLGAADVEDIRQLKSFRGYVEGRPRKEQAALLTDDALTKDVIHKLMQQLREGISTFYTGLKCLQVLVAKLPGAPLGQQLRELYSEGISHQLTDSAKYKECVHLLGFQAKDELLEKLHKMVQILEGDIPQSAQLGPKLDTVVALRKKLQDISVNPGTRTLASSPCKLDLNVTNRKQLKEKLLMLRDNSDSRLTGYESMRQEVLSVLGDDVLVDLLRPPSSLPLHEVVVLDNLDSVKRAIDGAPRAALHTALNNPQQYLQCDCCEIANASEIRATMPDICIAYKLHLESGALINVYDWLQSFMTVVSSDGGFGEDDERIHPEIQARFTQAVAELQLLGFIKTSKRKADHVARLTWGGTG